jgi:hypothetical protein
MRVLVTLLAIASVACTATPDHRDDIAVLRAALETTCANQKIAHLIISDSATDPAAHSLPRAWSAEGRYWRGLLGRPSAALWPHGPLCANVRIVARTDIDAAMNADPRAVPDWKNFTARFPGVRGYSAFSRPIYSGDGIHALVFSDHHCEGHCGLGEVIELEYAEGRWREARRALTWIA